MEGGIEMETAATSSTQQNLQISIQRPIFTQLQFDELYREKPEKNDHTAAENCQKFGQHAKKCCLNYLPSSPRQAIFHFFPLIAQLSRYNWKQDAIRDLVAGLTVGFLHIPQAMSYAQLATLDPIYGLYVAFFPGLIYALLGTSRQMSFGVYTIVSLMIAKSLDNEIASGAYEITKSNVTVNGTASNDPAAEMQVRIEISSAFALIVGIIQVILGILGAGFLADYLNEPFVSGYTTASAIHVLVSQFWPAMGIPATKRVGPMNLILLLVDWFRLLPKTNPITFGVFAVSLVFLVLWKEFVDPQVKKKIPAPIPIELILIIISVVASYFLDLKAHKVKIVGHIPTGLPAPAVPKSMKASYIGDAIPIVLVAFSVNIAMAKMFAKKYGYKIRPNQELVAMGASNIFCCFFECFTACAALSRSVVQANVGGRSQLASIVSSCVILVVILALGRYLEPLPNAVLAAVIVSNLKSLLLQFNDLPKFWRLCKLDFITWIVTFVATILIDVDLGLYIGVGFVLVTLIYRTGVTKKAVMKRLDSTEVFADMRKSKNLQLNDPIVVIKWSSPIYFANIDNFCCSIKQTLDPNEMCDEDAAADGAERLPITATHVVLDLSAVPFIDTAGVDFIKMMSKEIEERLHIEMHLASVPRNVLKDLYNETTLREFLCEHVHLSVVDAIQAIKINATQKMDKKQNGKGANGNISVKESSDAV